MGSIYCGAFLLDCITLYSGLFLGTRHPGARLERVCSAGGVFADLFLAEAGGRCMALGQSPCRSCYQTFLILLGL